MANALHNQQTKTEAHFTTISGSGRQVKNSAYADNGSLSAKRDLLLAPSVKNNTGSVTFESNADEIAGFSNNALSTISETAKNFSDTLKDVYNSALGKLSELSETKQTDGISGISKTFLWLALGGLLIVAWAWTKKKN